MGAKETEATNFLEKKLKGGPQFTYDEAVQTAIAALQGVLSEEFKSSDLEVWCGARAGACVLRLPLWAPVRGPCARFSLKGGLFAWGLGACIDAHTGSGSHFGSKQVGWCPWVVG